MKLTKTEKVKKCGLCNKTNLVHITRDPETLDESYPDDELVFADGFQCKDCGTITAKKGELIEMEMTSNEVTFETPSEFGTGGGISTYVSDQEVEKIMQTAH